MSRLAHHTIQIGPVAVAWSPVSNLGQVRATAFDAFTEPERARIETMADARADAFLLGRHLLRTVAVDCGVAARESDVIVTARCTHCGDHHGRPEIDRFRASISHAGGIAVVALAPREAVASLGIDTEPHGALPDEAKLLEWVSREAILKADRRGLRGLVPIDLDIQNNGGSAVVRDSGRNYHLTRVLIPAATTVLAVEVHPS